MRRQSSDPHMLFTVEPIQPELDLEEASPSADAVEAKRSVTHSRCSTVWGRGGSWLTQVDVHTPGTCHCPSRCLAVSGFAAHNGKVRFIFGSRQVARCTVRVGPPEAHLLSLNIISVVHSWPLSELDTSVFIPLLYAAAVMTYVVKAIQCVRV